MIPYVTAGMLGPFKRFRGSRDEPEQHFGGSPLPRWERAIEPPECPAGWRTGPPDFVGVGTQRAGTSWWYRYAIEAHPRVNRANPELKELHFFDRFWTEPVPDDLAADYARMFPRPEGSLAGEWTPRYIHDPWTPPLLARAAPDARLIVTLRDPIDRFMSGIARDRRRLKRQGRSLPASYISDHIGRSLYLDSLRRLFGHFERDRVLVLQYERCLAEPVAEAGRTQAFLGLDPIESHPPELTERTRPEASKPELTDHMRATLAGHFSEDAAGTIELCGLEADLWPTLS